MPAVIVYAPEGHVVIRYACACAVRHCTRCLARLAGDAGKDRACSGAHMEVHAGGRGHRSGGGEEEAGEHWRKIYDLDLGERGG